MRILMITSSYPLPGDPGWGPFIRDHARAVRERGHDVAVLCPSLDRGAGRMVDDAGVEVHTFPYTLGTPPMLHCAPGLLPSVRKSVLARWQLPGFFGASVYFLRKLAREWRPDVLHAHWFVPGGLAAALVKPGLGIPLVTLGHGADLHLPNTALVRRALAFVHQRSDVSIVVSRYLQERAAVYGLPADEIGVAHNGVDVESFRPGPSTGRRPSGDPLRVGVIRRLVPEKRVTDVIAAVSMMRERRALLRIAGDGPEGAALRRRVETAGLGDRVEFVGPLPHGRVPEFLRGLDVVVNPSAQEGLSIGNLEAMATGVPVIACRGFGNEEMIEHRRTGLLYAPGDERELSEAIGAVRWRSRDHAAMRRRAREVAVSRFSLDRASRDWEGAYETARRLAGGAA